MDPALVRRLNFILSCGADDRAAMVQAISEDFPQDANSIRDVYACFQASLNAPACLQAITAERPLNYSSFSAIGRFFCASITRNYEDALHTRTSLPESQANTQILREQIASSSVPQDERVSLSESISFYQSLLQSDPSRSTFLFERFEINAQWREWRSRYNYQGTPQVLQSSTCSPEWMAHHLTLPGFRYSIPIFVPQNLNHSWAELELELLQVFEALKFLPPSILERILRPPSGNPMSFFIAVNSSEQNYRNAIPALQDCGFNPNVGGEYFSSTNRIEIFHRSASALYRGNNRHFRSSFLIESLVHEIGHAIYDRILTEHEKIVLAALHEFSRPQQSVTTSWRERTPGAMQSMRTGIHALENTDEYFATLFADYVMHRMDEALGQSPQDESPHLQARLRILQDLFSLNGHNLHALTFRNVNSIYQSHGLNVNIENFSSIHILPALRVSVGFETNEELTFRMRAGVNIGAWNGSLLFHHPLRGNNQRYGLELNRNFSRGFPIYSPSPWSAELGASLGLQNNSGADERNFFLGLSGRVLFRIIRPLRVHVVVGANLFLTPTQWDQSSAGLELGLSFDDLQIRDR